MDLTAAARVLEALAQGNPEAQVALDALLEAAGVEALKPAPVPTVTGPVGFAGLLTLPELFWLSAGDESCWVPAERQDPVLAWSRLLSFGGPGLLRPLQGETWLQRFVHEVLPGRWRVCTIEDESVVALSQNRNISLSVPAHPSLLQVVERDGERHWDFRRGVSTYAVLSVIAHAACRAGIAPDQEVALGDGELVEVVAESFATGLKPLAVAIDDIEAWLSWTTALAATIRRISGRRLLRREPAEAWADLPAEAQETWTFWVRNHPGMLRLELALRDFFASGRQQAQVAVSLQRGVLPTEFAGPVTAICAPGMGPSWQAAVAERAQALGIQAILESPRFAQHPPPPGIHLDDEGWTVGDADYESHPDTCRSDAEVAPWRVVDNPLAQGSYDQHRAAPPAGILAAQR
ncbi:MAG: hypothetical protein ACI8RZ_000318 [Myxococcota bacterium]